MTVLLHLFGLPIFTRLQSLGAKAEHAIFRMIPAVRASLPVPVQLYSCIAVSPIGTTKGKLCDESFPLVLAPVSCSCCSRSTGLGSYLLDLCLQQLYVSSSQSSVRARMPLGPASNLQSVSGHCFKFLVSCSVRCRVRNYPWVRWVLGI